MPFEHWRTEKEEQAWERMTEDKFNSNMLILRCSMEMHLKVEMLLKVEILYRKGWYLGEISG